MYELIATKTQQRPVFAPAMDIFDTENGMVLCADLPGVSKEQVGLVIDDNVLKIIGRVGPVAPRDANLVYCEYRFGDFARSFILSEEVDLERISAEFDAGVLTIILPKAKRGPARRIEITTPDS